MTNNIPGRTALSAGHKYDKRFFRRLLIVSLLTIPGLAMAARIASNVAWTGTTGNGTTGGGTANATIAGGAGLAVTATPVANNFIGIGNPGTLGSSLSAAEAGINPAWYTPNMNPTTSRFGFNMMVTGTTTFSGTAIDPACAHAANTPIGSTITCHSGSTVTITFQNPVTNPVIDVSRLGGNFFNGSGNGFFNLWASYQVTTPGASLSLLSGNGQLAVTGGNTITHTAIPAGRTIGNTVANSCSDAVNVATGCGSVQVNGTFTTLTFSGAFNVQRASGTAALDTTASGSGMGDAAHFMITVSEDYGDAPASYDQSLAASHIVSDLRLGAGISADTPTAADGSQINSGAGGGLVTASPIASASASTDASDDGATFPATISATGGTITTVPVTLSGASKAGVVCGWIDFNKNGTFADAGERSVCVSFAAGATSANLVFTAPVGTTAGTTFARVRASYDSTFTIAGASPIGLLNSGEVEDYQVVLTLISNLSITKSDGTTTAVSGATTTYSIVASNGGPNAANNAIVKDPAVPGLNCTMVTCSASGGAVCPASPTVTTLQGSGLIIPTFPAASSLTFTLTCTVQ